MSDSNTRDGAGIPITSTGAALDVNIKSGGSGGGVVTQPDGTQLHVTVDAAPAVTGTVGVNNFPATQVVSQATFKCYNLGSSSANIYILFISKF